MAKKESEIGIGTAKQQINALLSKRKKVLLHCWVDEELKREIRKAVPKGTTIKETVQVALLNVLAELNPKIAERIKEHLAQE